jgi:hypothetical protein
MLLRLESTHAKTKEKKEKQDKTKDNLPLILLSKKKRIAVAFVASSSPFLWAGVPSACCRIGGYSTHAMVSNVSGSSKPSGKKPTVRKE